MIGQVGVERRGTMRPCLWRWLLFGAALLVASCNPSPTAAQPARTPQAMPVLAYYYIWFDESSWNRAKLDFPLLGRYSSDDGAVMRQHIQWAKQAGISGFIVSWKNTPTLTRRLTQLMQIANEENFKLSIIYEGLDVARQPLPVDEIGRDLDYLVSQFGSDQTLTMFDKPMVIWSGTWQFSRDEVASVTATRRDALLVLASERNQLGYERLADVVDGNAYYWSSVDPDKDREFASKLTSMGQVVHDHGGTWIAPAAAGFDARLIGGTRVVDRKDGETLGREIAAAMAAAPDAVGLISWNEFTENSYLEPSQKFGSRYLDVLASILGR
jgi:Glycosyl hydrolase family 71